MRVNAASYNWLPEGGHEKGVSVNVNILLFCTGLDRLVENGRSKY